MKKITPLLLVLILFNINTFAKPIFIKSKHLIATLYSAATGTVSLSTGTAPYQLRYLIENDIESAVESDYWIIKEQSANEYSFQNAATLQYIKYDALSTIYQSALVLVNSLQADKSTSFKLELTIVNKLSYYVIRSVLNNTKVWHQSSTPPPGNATINTVGANTASAGSNKQQFLFYDSEGISVKDDTQGFDITPPTSGRSLGAFSLCLDSLTFDKKSPAVDTPQKEFYITIPEIAMGADRSINVIFKPKVATYKLYINNLEVVSGSNFNFFNILATTILPIEVRNGVAVIASGKLKFTCLPMVQIYPETTIGAVYISGRIIISEADKNDTTVILNTDIKIRGASSSSYPKKQYSLKLKDVDGITPLYRSFYGLREDNNWVLDAMYIDPSRMRNRVSTDLWNDFSTRPYYAVQEPKMINGTRGHFVEVFMDDQYAGLYCMTEKVDRKQLNLKKLVYNLDGTTTQRGGLYKAVSWTTSTLLGFNYGQTISMYNNASESWNGWEVKYPDLGDGEPINWMPLYYAVNASSYLSTDDVFIHVANTHYDVPVFMDYYLFIDLLLTTDNQGKNTFLSIYDQTVSAKLSISPWDCDGTWGRRWDGTSNSTPATLDVDTYILNAQNNLISRLRKLNFEGFNAKMKSRYLELRGTYFTYTGLMSRFENYFNLFEKSGALDRETLRWPKAATIRGEKPYLQAWIKARLEYMDMKYLGKPYVSTGVANGTAKLIQIAPNPVRDMITLSGLVAGEMLQIISLQGTVMYQTQSSGENMVIDMRNFTSGVYLLKTGNDVTKILKR